MLNLQLKRFNKKALKTLLALSVLLALSLISCGKRKPPQPPLGKVKQTTIVDGFQRGNAIVLKWKLPLRNAQTERVENISGVDVYRLVVPVTDNAAISEEEFATRSTKIDDLKLSASDFERSDFTFIDSLQFATQAARIYYAVRFYNSQGQRAVYSNFFAIEPTGKTPTAPTSLSYALSQTAIALKWSEPAENIDGSKPANVIGYNVYRASDKNNPAKLLTASPINSSSFADEAFEFQKNYQYFVRAVANGRNGDLVESAESAIISVSPTDTFPPDAPAALTIAAAPNSISIFFTPNREFDIAGYKVFRKTDASEWMLMTKELINTTSYIDKSVESGTKYYYYVIAVDKYLNESARSEVVADTAP